MVNPNLVLNYDHVLSADEIELIDTTIRQIYNLEDPDDLGEDELTINFSTRREVSGCYETTALVYLHDREDERQGGFYLKVLGRPYVPRLIVPAKYKIDFINQQSLFHHPELKFTPFTDPSGKEMLYVEFVDPDVFPDIKYRFNSLCEFIYQQENPKPRGPRFPNLKVEEE